MRGRYGISCMRYVHGPGLIVSCLSSLQAGDNSTKIAEAGCIMQAMNLQFCRTPMQGFEYGCIMLLCSIAILRPGYLRHTACNKILLIQVEVHVLRRIWQCGTKISMQELTIYSHLPL